MFEQSSWESDNFTDSLALGIGKKYKQPKDIRKKKLKDEHKRTVKDKLKTVTSSISKKSRKHREQQKSKVKNSVQNRKILSQSLGVQQQKDLSTTNGKPEKIHCQHKEENDRYLEKVKQIHGKKNKYKDLSGKVKDVGSDTRLSSPIIDIPRKIKFIGKSNTLNVSEWENQKQNIKRLKKNKKRNLKKVQQVNLNNSRDISEQSRASSEDNTSSNRSKKNQQIHDKKTKLSKKVVQHSEISHLSDAEREMQTVESSSTKPKKPKKRRLEKESPQKYDTDESDIPSKQSKKVKRNKYKDFNQSPQQGKNIVLSVLEDQSSQNPDSMLQNSMSSGSPSKNKSTFNIDKLKMLLSEDTIEDTNDRDKRKEKNKQKKEKKPSTLREKMQKRLNAARFRYLNEALYTQTGEEAKILFQEDPQAFLCYHTGFQDQVDKWSKNPVDIAVDYIKARPVNLLVADFGCGEAKIAQSVRNKVVSFDLVAINKYVTACDMTNVPLDASSVDIAVFCLSLMGTNLVQYICEAHRVLKNGGVMLVAEVTSRFEKVGAFIRKVDKMGFSLQKQDQSSKMFMWFEFKKTGRLPDVQRMPNIELAPCLYKKR